MLKANNVTNESELNMEMESIFMGNQSIALTTGVKRGVCRSATIATKPSNFWKLTMGLAVAVMFSPHAAVASPDKPGTLQFISRTVMTNTGVVPGASGKIDETITSQGTANNQQLKISAAKLDPNTAYLLVAFIGDDSNATSVAEFTTDKEGKFSVSYMKKAQGKLGQHVELLPNVLDPMCNVLEMDIVDSNMVTVLQGVLTNPDKGRYMVKRSMSNTGFLPAATGELTIQASPNSTRFQLRASDLTPNTDYDLAINDNVVQTNTSNKKGDLTLKALPPGSPAVLDIQIVELTDGTGTNVVLITGGLGIPCTTAGQAPSFLGTAANFAVLAGSTVANTGPSTVKGDLGLSPGSAVTGFPPGTVTGKQYVADTTAAQAQLDLTTAYNDAAGRSVGAISVSGNLGGMTLASGLYKSTSSLEISSGDLTLDAQGDVNGVFIFQMASTLTTTAGRQVILSGGAKASNVFWQVGSSATLGTTSVFKGTIMANQSITLTTGATLEGRALASIGGVTLDSNTVTIPAP